MFFIWPRFFAMLKKTSSTFFHVESATHLWPMHTVNSHRVISVEITTFDKPLTYSQAVNYLVGLNWVSFIVRSLLFQRL